MMVFLLRSFEIQKLWNVLKFAKYPVNPKSLGLESSFVGIVGQSDLAYAFALQRIIDSQRTVL